MTAIEQLRDRLAAVRQYQPDSVQFVIAQSDLSALLDVAEAAQRRREMDENFVKCRTEWDETHDALAALALSNATVFAEAGERDLNRRLEALGKLPQGEPE